MASNKGDDLSDLLNQLADKQQREAEELGALLEGGAHAARSSPTSSPPASAEDEDATTVVDPLVNLAGEAGEAGETKALSDDPSDAAATLPEDGLPSEVIHAAEPTMKSDSPSADAASTADDVEPSSAGATTAEDDLAAALASTNADPDAAAAAAEIAAAAPAWDLAEAPVARRRTRPAPAPQTGGGLKAVGAPLLVTIGLITLVPAIWATMLLLGMDVPLKDRDGAGSMAKLMLVAWPVGLILVVAGIVMIMQVREGARKSKQNLNE